jgi:chromosome segregation ATPase
MAPADNEDTQTIEELQQRFQNLHQQKIRAEANRDNAEKQLDELKREARETYGTDDIEELKQKLAEMKAENEKRRADYQAQLDRIESELAEVEATFASENGREESD